ncbi:septum formation family protein [Promicromonospora vindobonensis]|uniref:Septum formation family protein n=1 Tax=Promicromonospora vindobonensis TaxID=195748 RepID=A0ABW5W4R8_9MICO
MADTKQTPGEEPEPVAPAAEPATASARSKTAQKARPAGSGHGPASGKNGSSPAEDARDAEGAAPAQDADGAAEDDAPATDGPATDGPVPDSESDSVDDADADADDTDADTDDDDVDVDVDVDVEDDTTAEGTAVESGNDQAKGPEPELAGEDDAPAGPYPTRVGWVVAAFLFFWPLAIPALVLSMRTAEANGTGNTRRAKKSSVRALDFALGGVVIGALGIVGLAVGIAAAPTYASSLPAGFVSTVKSFVPPALAAPLGITQPDDDAELAAPTSSPTPSDDPYATADPYAPEPDADGPIALPTPEIGDQAGSTDEPTSSSDPAATTGAEIPDLAVGDCFDTAATSGQTTLYRIPVVPCTTAHGGEIYAETTAPDSLAKNGETPTQQELWDAADAYCYPEFTKFVGLRWAKSELQYWPIAPSEQSWAEGDRRILCVVESEEPVTGSLEGAER